ncbi:hypothetical protein Aperf_G00000120826 [Anoplocephala perfoliata]
MKPVMCSLLLLILRVQQCRLDIVEVGPSLKSQPLCGSLFHACNLIPLCSPPSAAFRSPFSGTIGSGSGVSAFWFLLRKHFKFLNISQILLISFAIFHFNRQRNFAEKNFAAAAAAAAVASASEMGEANGKTSYIFFVLIPYSSPILRNHRKCFKYAFFPQIPAASSPSFKDFSLFQIPQHLMHSSHAIHHITAAWIPSSLVERFSNHQLLHSSSSLTHIPLVSSSSAKFSKGTISPVYGPNIVPTGVSISAQTPKPAPLILERPTWTKCSGAVPRECLRSSLPQQQSSGLPDSDAPPPNGF